MKILIAPDKFKGSLTAVEVCNAVEIGLRNVSPNSEIVKLPLADGGEGTLEALELKNNFERQFLIVSNPLFMPIESWYGLKGDTAFIEMAKASGLQLLNDEERNPNLTTSFGTGELLGDAVLKGAKKIFLFIGGSATNDAALGIASALGYKFFDSDYNELMPVGSSLIKVKSIEYIPKVELEGVQIIVLTDVQNPFLGENGASYVYAGQKGADENSIKELDKGLRNIADIFLEYFDKDIVNVPGSGAAGGIGGGMIAFFNASLRSGINSIFELLNFDKVIEDCDLVITGEGKFDSQTLEGKAVKGVIDKSKKFNRSVGVVCGISTLTDRQIKGMGIKVKQLKTNNISIDESVKNAHKYLVERSEELIKEISN